MHKEQKEPDIETWIKSAQISIDHGKKPFFKVGLIMDMGRGTFIANIVTTDTFQIVNKHILKVTRKNMKKLKELDLIMEGISCKTR